MILISHRGNLDGPNKSFENSPSYICEAIDRGFDVEVDLWKTNKLFFGHAEPQYCINNDLLIKNSNHIWLHCKNLEALLYCREMKLHYFWHDEDSYAITSKGFIWAHPNAINFKNTILVMPEKKYGKLDYRVDSNIAGICTDYPLQYRSKN